MEKDTVYRVEISLKATAYHFAPGHRLRLWISSSDFPGYDRNLNTGGHNETETDFVSAQQTIYHDAAHPSHVLLPRNNFV